MKLFFEREVLFNLCSVCIFSNYETSHFLGLLVHQYPLKTEPVKIQGLVSIVQYQLTDSATSSWGLLQSCKRCILVNFRTNGRKQQIMEIYIFIVVVTFCLSDGLEGLRVPPRARPEAPRTRDHTTIPNIRYKNTSLSKILRHQVNFKCT